MSSWKPKFKLTSKVFAILRKRPNIDEKENGHIKANDLAGHDHSDIPQPLNHDSAPTPGHDDSRSDASLSFGARTSSPDDSVHHANVHPSGSFFTGARNLTLNGGEFYNVGGNLTIQRTDPREIVEMAVACAMEVHAQMNDRRLEEMMGYLQLPRTISVGLIYIMDATGRQHALTMNMARSFEQFNKALRILFELGSPQDRLLVKYMNIGAYNLNIDDGRKQRQLTNQEEWSSVVQRDTNIVMRVVMVQQTDEKKYKCPFCEFWNKQEDYGQTSIVNCCSCKRPFQVTPTGDLDATVTNHAMEAVLAVPNYERDLLSNVYLKPGMIGGYTCHTGFRAREGGVTLLDVMQHSPDYAFLFASQTTIGGEKISDEAIHLAAATLDAGYCGMWKKV